MKVQDLKILNFRNSYNKTCSMSENINNFKFKWSNVLRSTENNHNFTLKIFAYLTYDYYYVINQVISYWLSYRSEVSCIGPRPKAKDLYS